MSSMYEMSFHIFFHPPYVDSEVSLSIHIDLMPALCSLNIFNLLTYTFVISALTQRPIYRK